MKRLVSVKAQIITSSVMLIGALVGWPLSALTVAQGEPPVILGLSWFALIYTGYTSLITALTTESLKDSE